MRKQYLKWCITSLLSLTLAFSLTLIVIKKLRSEWAIARITIIKNELSRIMSGELDEFFQLNSLARYNTVKLEEREVKLYYHVIETLNGSAELGIFIYEEPSVKYVIYYGIDYPSNTLIIAEKPNFFYIIPYDILKRRPTHSSVVSYILQLNWRTKQIEDQGKASPEKLWPPMADIISYMFYEKK